jgi:mRNA interferase HigB
MRIVGRDVLDAFCAKHPDGRRWIEAWLHEADAAVWLTPQDIKNRYASASFLAGNTVIFNVKGNQYRLEVVFAYYVGVVSVVWAGTHSEYDERNRGR